MKTMKQLCLIAFGFVLIGAPAFAEEAAEIVVPYLHIKTALANDSIDGVTDAARSIAAEAAKMTYHWPGNVAVDATQAIATAAQTLVRATDIKTARAAFGPLSDALIQYADEVGLGQLKVAYCPMVQKSWVQEDGAIRNPFYGSAMLSCGTFTR
jgi:hypothetical protein